MGCMLGGAEQTRAPARQAATETRRRITGRAPPASQSIERLSFHHHLLFGVQKFAFFLFCSSAFGLCSYHAPLFPFSRRRRASSHSLLVACSLLVASYFFLPVSSYTLV
ncbi:hypothetical protein MAPG_01199 [Magnaporthiopsis poae ATCC 64411]|uniref:Transmembrane protein n=1 Tax=Magnaporthiopsis poae (strain ATCC 64411 / 73-15) TaxID=644358 RepID=A0A0C4DN26_MAGP6|nr:hypothetical protein MAPG_01199 [Magnaporthiopsis poae ATCC 64411]